MRTTVSSEHSPAATTDTRGPSSDAAAAKKPKRTSRAPQKGSGDSFQVGPAPSGSSTSAAAVRKPKQTSPMGGGGTVVAVRNDAQIRAAIATMVRSYAKKQEKRFGEQGVTAKPLIAAYESASKHPAHPSDGLIAMVRTLRAQVAGIDLSNAARLPAKLEEHLSERDTKRVRDAYERLFGLEVMSIEPTLFRWIAETPGAQAWRGEAKAAYQEALLEKDLAKAVRAGIGALPKKQNIGFPPPEMAFLSLLAEARIPAEEAKKIVDKLGKSTGQTKAAMLVNAMASAEDDNRTSVLKLGQTAIAAGKAPGDVALAILSGLEAQGTTAWFTNFISLRDLGILTESELSTIHSRRAGR